MKFSLARRLFGIHLSHAREEDLIELIQCPVYAAKEYDL
jgi:hypothetical protein